MAKSKNILFIVEGESDEPDFLGELFRTCFPNAEIRCWSYRTSLHDLVCELYPAGEFDSDIDILLCLRSKARTDEERMVLSESMHYTDIFMIFDFEPHYSHLEWKRICGMLEYYRHSDDEGKLLINYPMMQSYKHLKKLPDMEFRDRTIPVDEAGKYKDLVGRESGFTQLCRYTYPVWMSVCGHHLMKCNYILSGKCELPSAEEYLSFEQVQLFDAECEKHTEKRMVDVINTAVFLLLEYEPVRVLCDMNRHRDRYFLGL